MAKLQDPLFLSELECPVCKTINKFENIRAGAYSESGRDRDFKPTGRVWQNSAYQKYDPLLFFMATCSKCYYTREFTQDYKNWKNDTAFKTYRQKTIQQNHLAEFTKPDGIVKFLGKWINHQGYPFESAVIKLLLGIFDAKMSGRPSNLDIGRYFLRIAWLFRDKYGPGTGVETGDAGFFRKLRGAAMGVNQMVPGYDEKVNSIKQLIDCDFTGLFNDKPEAGEYKRQIDQAIAEMTSSIGPLADAATKLQTAFINAERALTGSQLSTEENFHDYPDFRSFLIAAREKWDEVTEDEQSALLKASEYYTKAYEAGSEISQGIQQVQAAYMIAELSRRTGDYDHAGQYFNQAIRLGREIVIGKRGDSSTVNFTKTLLEMAMDQARLCNKEAAGDTK